jgi:hypothetical protein
MILNSPYITGSLTVTGNIIASGSITISGSIASSSYAVSASEAAQLQGLGSASFAPASTFNTVSQSFATTSASLSTRVTNEEATSSVLTSASSSFATMSGSLSTRVTIIEGQDATTGSNTFTGPQHMSDVSNAISFTSTASLYTDGGFRVAKDSFVSGTAYFNNITVYGTSSIQYITSSQVNIGSNIITVNTDTPAIRFGGLSVFDSGSTGLTGSLFWDSEKNHWVYANPSGSTYSGGMLMSGPRSSALGDEQGTLNNYVMKGQGGDHITSSQIIDDGTTVRIPGALQVTGSLVGSSTATFSDTVTISKAAAISSLIVKSSSSTTGLWLYLNGLNATLSNQDSGSLAFQTNGTDRLTISSAGAATFTGALSGTSATFSGGVTSNGTFVAGLIGGNIQLKGSTDGFLGVNNSNTLFLTDWATAAKGLQINLSTGAATFSNIIGVNGATEAGWSIKSNGNSKVESGSGTTVMQINDTSTGGRAWSFISAGAGNAHSVPAGNFYLRNSTDGITAFSILPTTGNIGFGRVSARGKAEFVTGLPTSIPIFSNTTNGIVVSDGGAVYGRMGVSNFSAASAGYPTYIQAGDFDGAIYYNLLLNPLGGNVGIGTSSPVSKLQIGTASVYPAGGYTLQMSNGTTEFLITLNSAQVGSSTTFYSSTDYYFNRSGPSSTGIITAFGFNNISDYRMKENLSSFNPFDIINNIKTYKYDMIDTKETQYGVLAHEIQEVLPHIVVGVKDGDRPQSVDYSKIVPILVKAIQEQQAQIEELKALIKTS